MSKLNEFIKPRVHNILFDAGYSPLQLDRKEFKRTVFTPGEWQEYQNYYVQLSADEWWYQKPQRKGDDIMVFGDYSTEGLESSAKLLRLIQPNRSN